MVRPGRVRLQLGNILQFDSPGRRGRYRVWSDLFADHSRITSYNVCYTKLLRDLVEETERPRVGKIGDEFLLEIEEARVLASQHRVLVIDHDREAVVVGGEGHDVDALGLVRVADGLLDDEIIPFVV